MLRLTTAFVVAILLALPSHALEVDVIEGAIITHDSATRIVYARSCQECDQIKLQLTDETVIYIDGKAESFTDQPHINGLTDLGYNAEKQVVLWFRPLFAKQEQ